MLKEIKISEEEIRGVLKDYLEDHYPTEEEISGFIDCLKRDVSQWLSDNAEWYVKNELPKE